MANVVLRWGRAVLWLAAIGGCLLVGCVGRGTVGGGAVSRTVLLWQLLAKDPHERRWELTC